MTSYIIDIDAEGFTSASNISGSLTGVQAFVIGNVIVINLPQLDLTVNTADTVRLSITGDIDLTDHDINDVVAGFNGSDKLLTVRVVDGSTLEVSISPGSTNWVDSVTSYIKTRTWLFLKS